MVQTISSTLRRLPPLRMPIFPYCLATILFIVGANSTAQDDSDNENDIHEFHKTLVAAADWAFKIKEGQSVVQEEHQLRMLTSRFTVTGRTLVENGERFEVKVFEIAQDNDRMIFLQAEKGAVQLMVGAPVSKPFLRRLRRESDEPIVRQNEKKLTAVMELIDEVTASIYESQGVRVIDLNARPIKNDIFFSGSFALFAINLNRDLTVDQLADFLLILWMKTRSDGSCGPLILGH